MKRVTFLSLIAIMFLSACSQQLNYFTEDIYEKNKWSESELKQIQFYVSEDIELERVRSASESSITDGQIQINKGRKVEKIVIRKGTPGTLVFSPSTNRFAVSFDDDPSNYLMFGPNPKARGKYVLLAKDWKKHTGIVSYGNSEYQTTSESAFAALMVDIRQAKKMSYTKTTASGRTIKG